MSSIPPLTWEDALGQSTGVSPGLGWTVVLSTKYGGGKGLFFDSAVAFENALTALGCKVYNPNTQLKAEGFTDEECNIIWLDRYTEAIEITRVSQAGFVLQIQQGSARSKSHHQAAEERMAGWAACPIIGAYLPEEMHDYKEEDAELFGRLSGGIDYSGMPLTTVIQMMCLVKAWCALDIAKDQIARGVRSRTFIPAEGHSGYSQIQWF